MENQFNLFNYNSILKFFPCGYFCRMLITLANSFDPDQNRHSVGPDLDPNRLTVFLKECLEKADFEKKNSQQMTRKHEKYPTYKELIYVSEVFFLSKYIA